jgi:hypothetical protein
LNMQERKAKATITTKSLTFVSRFAFTCVLARALESALAVGVARARHNITVVDSRALETRALRIARW